MSWEGIFCTRGFIMYWVFPSLTGRAHLVLKGYIIYLESPSSTGRVHHLRKRSIFYWEGTLCTGLFLLSTGRVQHVLGGSTIHSSMVHDVLGFYIIEWESPSYNNRVHCILGGSIIYSDYP